MKTRRWLLPFTFGVDMSAIDSVVQLAESAGATLFPVSFISAPPTGARLEYIQQSKDFLEAVQNKAARFQAPVECYEVFTMDVLQSLAMLVRERHCEEIVLVTSGEQTRLMGYEEVKRLLIEPPAALVLIRLPARSGLAVAPHAGARLLSWLSSRWKLQDGTCRTHKPIVEEPLWIRTEQHHLGG